MKILKLAKSSFGSYSAVFDYVPELTYEKIGKDYVGSVVNSQGEIIASGWLKKSSWGGAFAGREISLKMKDGSIDKIKDYWFDAGSYPKHGEFMSIGAETLGGLQECYVYFGYNINKKTFEKMIDEYLKYDKIYSYREVEEWCNLLHEWHDVYVHGEKIPFMMNKFGDMVEKETKKRVSAMYNRAFYYRGVWKHLTIFKFSYKNEDGRLIKLEANYLKVLKATLPQSLEEIKINNKLPLSVSGKG